MFLDASDHIQNELEKIKQINERAHAEISIRESLRELEVWSGSAEFTLVESTTTQGVKVHLVKDWRDTLAELGDQQRLVATLKESPAAGSSAFRRDCEFLETIYFEKLSLDLSFYFFF